MVLLTIEFECTFMETLYKKLYVVANQLYGLVKDTTSSTRRCRSPRDSEPPAAAGLSAGGARPPWRSSGAGRLSRARYEEGRKRRALWNHSNTLHIFTQSRCSLQITKDVHGNTSKDLDGTIEWCSIYTWLEVALNSHHRYSRSHKWNGVEALNDTQHLTLPSQGTYGQCVVDCFTL